MAKVMMTIVIGILVVLGIISVTLSTRLSNDCASQQPADKVWTERSSIVVEQAPNPDVREYNVKQQISESVIEEFSRNFHGGSDYQSLGHTGQRLIEQLLKIDGVEDIFIKPYSLHITKGKAFSWDALHEPILNVIETALKEKTSS